MPVETAADRAAFFAADEFGVEGAYTPPAGAPVAVTLLRWRPDELGWRPLAADAELFAGARLAAADQQHAWVVLLRRDEVALAERGGTVTMDGRAWPVRRAASVEDGECWLLGLGPSAAVP